MGYNQKDGNYDNKWYNFLTEKNSVYVILFMA